MRVLLDECLPRQLRSRLVGQDAQTVRAMGWSGKKNGELLRLASEANFDVLITADRNIPHQQNLASGAPAVVVLAAVSNRLQDLLPLMPAVLTALESIRRGEFVEIGPENAQNESS